MAARIEIRVGESEKAVLLARARAEGKTLTQLVRDGLFGSERDDWQEQVERRLSRLEELANL